MTRTPRTLILIPLIFGILLLAPHPRVLPSEEEKTAEELKPVLEAYELILERYYDTEALDEEELLKGAVQGMVDALPDEYSEVLTKEEFEGFEDRLEGRIEGLGLVLVKSSNGVKVLETFPRTPASRGGLGKGDEILSIDGRSTEGLDLEEVYENLRGEDGTEVELTVRYSEGEEETVVLTQNLFRIPPVQLELLADGRVALFDINRFTSTASWEFQTALHELDEDDLRGYIIDLRNNPGGHTNEALEVAEKFVDEGELARFEFREDARIMESGGNDLPNLPLVILVNEHTASTSELLGGILRARKVGVLAGRRTGGKGLGQNSFAIGGTLFLKLTTSRTILPSGEGIPRAGLEPDLKSPEFTRDLEVALDWIEEHEGERFPLEEVD